MSRGVLTTPPTQIGTLRRGRLSYSGNCCRFLKFKNLSRFVHQRPRAVFAEAEESRKNYKPNLSETELKQLKESVRESVRMKDGKPVEGFRYYKGLSDSIGK